MQYYNDFDYGGGYYDGYSETEEERRKREQALANTAIQTQEVKTYADGTVERTTKEEMPGEFAPAVQPRSIQPIQQQPVQQPVAPVRPDTYQRMIQAESGGRDFDAQGRPLTSPKGAMFAAQVMPATAASPGFGVRPAQAQTPEEYNRVGQDYYNAMLKRYGGNEQAAAAAYNAGPGRVDRNMQANAGQLNVAQLPQETQQYLQKVQPGMAAQAQPQMTAAQRQMAIVTGQTQAAQPATSTAAIDAYQQVQDDPMKLLALRNDQNAPAWIRERAGSRAFEIMSTEINSKQAQEQAKTLIASAAQGDRKASNTIARELQNQDGSWLKMILLGFISPQMAGEEAVKLGYGNKWQTTTDANGKAALIQVNAKGLPLKGYTSDGNEIATDELVQYAGGGKRELDIVGGTFVNDKTGEVGRMVTDKRTGRTQVQTDTGLKPMTGFRPQSSAGTMADMRSRAIQDLNIKLQGKGIEEQMQILRPYNQQLVSNGFPPVQPEEVGIRVPQVAQGAPTAPGAAAPVAPAAGMAPAPTAQGARPVPPTPMAAPAPAPAPAASGTGIGGRPTATQIEAGAAGATTAAKVTMDAAAAEVAKSPDTANTIRSIQKSIKVLESGKHNIGSMASGIAGRGPIAQAIGSQFETTDAKNTKQVMDLVQRLAADGLKALGSNPSTVDLEFWTKFKPDASSDPEFVKEWIDSRAGDLQRRVNYARQQMNLEPVFAKDEEQAAYEWTKKNPRDARTPQIRQKLGLQ